VSRKLGVLDRATSEFVSARVGPDGVQSGYKGLYWFGQEWPMFSGFCYCWCCLASDPFAPILIVRLGLRHLEFSPMNWVG
jgi:hypothetical protein